MIASIQKWGNSLALRIPKAYALGAHIESGSEVDVALEGGKIVISPVKRKRYRIDDLVSGITPDTLHKSVDTGAAVGKEAW